MDSGTEPRRLLEEKWAADWTAARGAVLAYCINALRGDYHTAEDVTQSVALRSLRGYPSFRGDSKFLSWVFVIARREVEREFAKRNIRANRETPLNLDIHGSIPSEPGLPVATVLPGVPTVDQLLDAAVAAELLSELEVQILRLCLLDSKLTWAELGKQLGIGASAASVAHFRAVPKLRVFLFMRCPASLGGSGVIAEAFTAAKKDAAKPLSPSEIEVFDALIIRKNFNYRKAGWQTKLRTACDRVIKCFPPGSARDLFCSLSGPYARS